MTIIGHIPGSLQAWLLTGKEVQKISTVKCSQVIVFQGVVVRYKGPSAAESILKFHRQLQNDKCVFIIMKSQQSCF